MSLSPDPLELAIRHLGTRERTTAELGRYLRRRGVREEAVVEVIDELTARGYLDDEGYARRFAEDRRALDGWGGERIEQRLRAAGIDEGTSRRAVASRDQATELDAAQAVLARRLQAPPHDDVSRRRALGLLVRKGYESELAYEAVRRFERAFRE